MGGVLEGIDQVDWARLTHAYGPATDVPDQIRALASPDEDVRKRALHKSFGNIFHQGTRYEATPHAVPFLLELLAAPDTPGKADLLMLLASIAIGYDETWLPGPVPVSAGREAAAGGEAVAAAAPHPGDDDYDEDSGDYEYVMSLSDDEQRRMYAYTEMAAYDAVRVGVPLFRSLLADGDASVRTWAASAVAWFPEDAGESLPALATVRGEPVSTATAVVAAGLLGGRPDPGLLADPDPLLRWAAAIAFANVDQESASQEVVAELLAQVVGETSGAVPFLDGDLRGYAALALGEVGERHHVAVFDTLLSRIPAVQGIPALPIVGQALRLAFPSTLAEGTAFSALDSRQQRLVSALVESPSTWQIGDATFANFSSLIRAYGLPSWWEKLRDYATVA